MNFLSCLKFSLIQFLLNKQFNFLTKQNEIVFDLLSNDKQMHIQNNFVFPNSSTIIFCSCFPIEYKYLGKDKILSIVNSLNEFSSVFNAYLKFDKDWCLLCIKNQVTLVPNQLIDENFWESEISTQINNASNIINFLYFDLPKSSYLKNPFDAEFEKFMGKCIADYTKAIKIVKEQKQKEDYLSWSKERINIKID